MHDVREEESEWNPFSGLGYLGGIMVSAVGGVTLVGGIVSLAVVSPAESRYAVILGIADPGLREASCAEALMGLARRGKRSRTARAVLCGALGLLAAASSGIGRPDNSGRRRGAGARSVPGEKPGREDLPGLPRTGRRQTGPRPGPGYRAARRLPGRTVPGFLAPHPPEDEGHAFGSLRR